jgi:hypothetical protein
MAEPIFVIGRDRSGTKWLSNIIATNKEVACVQHEDHFGILEASDILVTAPILFGNIRVPENYIAFLECLSQTDFIRLTGVNKDYCYGLRPTDCFIFFREIMDRFADNGRKSCWVQKSDVTSMNDLYTHFHDGKFIIITRKFKDNIKSRIGQIMRERGKDQKKHLFKAAVRYFIDMNQIKKYSNRNNVYVIQYEDLRKNKKLVLEKLCKFLQIEYEEIMLQDKFQKNTSYRNGILKDEIFTKTDLLKLNVSSIFLKSLPKFIYELLYARAKRKIKKQIFNSQEKKLISFKFRRKELGWD